jgi:hypothetical protein
MKVQVNGVNNQNNLNSNSPIVYSPIQNTEMSMPVPIPMLKYPI